MSFFSRLFTKTDPTSDWPPAQDRAPDVDLDGRRLTGFGGAVAFGDPLEAARVLGRPDEVSGGKGGAWTLSYERHGLTLEFEEGRFVHASFSIASGEDSADEPDAWGRERRGPDGRALSSRTRLREVLERFGEPRETQRLEGETVLYYAHGELVSELQFDEADRLTGWDVYLD